MRQTILINNEIYHIYNRGVDKRNIFLDEKDYQRFSDSLIVFNNEENLNGCRFRDRVECKNGEPLVNVIAYCMMPNHFHLLLEQLTENGIVKFIQKMTTSYTMYFNNRYKRTGALIQGVFKRSHIKTDSRLLEMSRYIHVNPTKIITSEISSALTRARLIAYPWSSLPDYAGLRDKSIILANKQIIMSQFSSPDQYINYVVGET